MDDVTPSVEQPPRRFRRLRIAVSVFFGLLTVALCLLWLRSYSWIDVVRKGTRGVASSEGKFLVNDIYNLQGKGSVSTRSFAGDWIHIWTARQGDLVGVGLGRMIPQWPAILFAAILSAVPWLHYRFSLRTMLIATTLIAAMLGLIGYTVR